MSAPFQKHSAASRQAAKEIEPHTGTLRRLIFEFIQANPGVSDLDIQTRLEVSKNTERPRRIELEGVGLIQPCGEDPGATGRTLFKAVEGRTYPDHMPASYWRSRMRAIRASRPVPEEFFHAVEEVQEALGDQEPSPGLKKVLDWLGLHGEPHEELLRHDASAPWWPGGEL